MSNVIKVSYEIEVKDERKFRDFYTSLQSTHYPDPETTRVERLLEDFIICQDIYRETNSQKFALEELGLELLDSYSKSEDLEDQDNSNCEIEVKTTEKPVLKYSAKKCVALNVY